MLLRNLRVKKLKRATFMPALTSSVITALSCEAGPNVQTIFVFSHI